MQSVFLLFLVARAKKSVYTSKYMAKQSHVKGKIEKTEEGKKVVFDYFRKIGTKRIIIMLIGNIIIGMGISIFKFSCMGNDAYNAMLMALSDCVKIPYGHFFVMANALLLVVQVIFGRKYIGIGTIVNSCLSGYVTTFFYNIWLQFGGLPTSFPVQFVIMILGVLACSTGVSLYQTADAGVSPFDSLSLMVSDRSKKVPYFWWRILFDALCALIGFLAGGLIGLGTLVCAFGMGPCTHFFNVHLSEKLLPEMKK